MEFEVELEVKDFIIISFLKGDISEGWSCQALKTDRVTFGSMVQDWLDSILKNNFVAEWEPVKTDKEKRVSLFRKIASEYSLTLVEDSISFDLEGNQWQSIRCFNKDQLYKMTVPEFVWHIQDLIANPTISKHYLSND